MQCEWRAVQTAGQPGCLKPKVVAAETCVLEVPLVSAHLGINACGCHQCAVYCLNLNLKKHEKKWSKFTKFLV